jgi:hypothetical protein
MKPKVTVQLMDATALKENFHRTSTVLGRQLEDLLRVVIVLAVPVPVAVLIMTPQVFN